MSENPSPLKTPVRIYAIATGLLLSFLWLVARRVALLWKKDEKWTVHALGAATVACLLYLGLCAIGFVMPFLPKLGESGP